MKRLMIIVPALLALSCAVRAADPPPVDLDALKTVPILENGRKMPLDTYARQKLFQFSGQSRYQKQPAINWLARLLFQPELAKHDDIFLVDHPEVVQALGIAAEGRGRYSMLQFEPALLKLEELARNAASVPDENRSLVDHELGRLYENVLQYFDLANTFAFARPDPLFTIRDPEVLERLGLEDGEGPYRFLDVYQRVHKLQPFLAPLADRDPETWSPFEHEVYRISQGLFRLAQQHQANSVALLPATPHGEETWLSPWAFLSMGLRDQGLLHAIAGLQDLSAAYANGDQAAFDRSAGNLDLFIRSRQPGDRDLSRIGLEVQYNAWKPFFWTKALYLLAFLAAVTALVSDRKGPLLAAVALTVAALLPHTAGIVMRMLIMGRPPVTNLYATFLFVAWVGVLLGLVMEAFQRHAFGVLTASFCGLALTLVAGRFGVEGDTLNKVVAVLDSNFWLTTHVLAITIGYAGCVAAGLVGHLVMLAYILRPDRAELHRSMYRALYGILGFGLLFAFLGTMLGGVWADQSWGRFWGWDPKENGALLIVLWCAVLFHARLGKLIGDLGMAAGAALGIIVVMVAWLGVNLLGVGLHSYGFTSGLARGFLTYIILQVVLVAALWYGAKMRIYTLTRATEKSPDGSPS